LQFSSSPPEGRREPEPGVEWAEALLQPQIPDAQQVPDPLPPHRMLWLKLSSQKQAHSKPYALTTHRKT
jgi:hypothetical protein